MTDKPTDEELKAMWQLHAADIGGIFDFARAVLAKWGSPAQAADSQPEPVRDYPPLPDFDTVEQHVYGACRRFITQGMLEPIHNLIRDAIDADRAALAKWGTPQQEAQEPCPTCEALARTVMMDQVSFDRKPDCYGIRQITDDEGVEEWEDIRTSPDVAREEANDMMATGRGEIYEVVPLWTTPQPTQAQAGAVPLTDGQIEDLLRCGNPTDEEKRLIRMGWDAAHGIKGGQHVTE